MAKSRVSYLLALIILGIIVILCVLLLLTGDVSLFISILYSPFSFLLLVVVLLEYVILKSMDRSRIYKLELEKLKRKRDREMMFRQRLESEFKGLKKYLEEEESGEELQSRLGKISKLFKEM